MWTVWSSGEIVCFGGEKKSCKRRQGKKELCVHFVFNRVTKLTPDWYIQFLSNYSCFLRGTLILSLVLGVTDFFSHDYGMKDGFIDFTGKKSINNSHNYRQKNRRKNCIYIFFIKLINYILFYIHCD